MNGVKLPERKSSIYQAAQHPSAADISQLEYEEVDQKTFYSAVSSQAHKNSSSSAGIGRYATLRMPKLKRSSLPPAPASAGLGYSYESDDAAETSSNANSMISGYESSSPTKSSSKTGAKKQNSKKFGHKKSSSTFSFDSMHQAASNLFARRRKSDAAAIINGLDTTSNALTDNDTNNPNNNNNLSGRQRRSFVFDSNGEVIGGDIPIENSTLQTQQSRKNGSVVSEESRKLLQEIIDEAFPALEWLTQEEHSILEKPVLEAVKEVIASEEPANLKLSDEVFSSMRQEVRRIRDQIAAVTQELDKESKFQEGSLSLMKIYSSKQPISLATNEAMKHPAGPLSGRKARKSHSSFDSREMQSQELTVMSAESPLPPLVPAMKASSAAFMESANYVVNLAGLLKDLTERERFLSESLMKHVLSSLIVGYSKTSRLLRESELERARALQLVQELGPKQPSIMDRWNVVLRDELMRTLCEEIVKINGDFNRIRIADGDDN